MKDTGARRLGNHAMIHLVLILGAVAMVFPFYWVVCTSFKTNYEAISFPPTLFPREPVFSNYGKALAAAPFGRYFLNSVIQAGGVSVGVLITSILAAYAFANMRFAGKNVIFTIVLATMMVPAEVTLIPNFVIIKKMGLYNTYLALILPFVGHVFSIFLLRQSFLNVPRDLYEAAAIDGCSHFRYLLDVMLPLSIPGISVVGLLAFFRSWNELLWPLVVTSSNDMRTVQVGLSAFSQDVSTDFATLMAASTMVILPVIVLFMFVQNSFIQGVASTGLKE